MSVIFLVLVIMPSLTLSSRYVIFFFFNVTATTECYTYTHTLSLHDALPIAAKYLVPSYPIGQVVWARYVGHVVRVAALLLPLHGRGLLVTQRPGLQVRSEEHTSELQ